ncbi:MAG: hypothetical protein J1E04_06330, partial [Alistipes sp.]|nr:hypothetical protein [Alistipes sp.]
MKKYLVILAAAIMGWSCEGFDDADLKSRLDDVEDRVDSVEQELAQLREMVKSINDSYGALVGVMNGGLITKIEVTADGYDITVRWNENGEIRDEVYAVKSGAKGDPGTAPELTLEKDEESGRYYWLIDGEEPAGGRVWATGEKGDKGDAGETGGTGAAGGKGDKGDAGQNGKTPTLAVNTGNTYPGDVSTGDKYWWVSYDDGANLTTPQNFSWQRLTVYDGTSSGGGGVVTVQY